MHALRDASLLAAIAAILILPATTLADSQAPVTDPSKIKEVDWSGLSDSQKRVALKVMNENGCNCGCKMTIAVCRERDSSCRRSLIFARTITDALHESKPETEVVRVLKAKTDTFVEAKL